MSRSSLLNFFLQVLLICLLARFFHYPVQGHHVVFENIGQMAGALSYMHVKVTLNLTHIHNQLIAYNQSLSQLWTHFGNLNMDPIVQNKMYYLGYDIGWSIRQKALDILKHHKIISAQMTEKLQSLRLSLPDGNDGPADNSRFFEQIHRLKREIQIPFSNDTISSVKKVLNPSVLFDQEVLDAASRARTLSDLAEGFVRSPRFLTALALPLGIFGTFMGLYNHRQIDLLRSDLKSTMAKHNRLVEVVQQQQDDLHKLNVSVSKLQQDLLTVTINDPAYVSSLLLLVEGRIQEQLQMANHVIQMAMQRRLSIDLLSVADLRALYDKILRKADRAGYYPLIGHHSDLFQIEASYFHDGRDVHLLLHVPMVPDGSLLRLFRLHPFPLPLSKEHMLVPDVDYDVLAISPGLERLATVLNYVDLMACHNVNNIYLCEQQGVLKTNINSTCLGSLYLQDFESAKLLCPLKIHDSEEIVEQLLNNWFLAYSPKALMAPVICHNGTNSEIHLKVGINSFHLSPGCRTKLKNHVVISDISLKESMDMMHYEWTWDAQSLSTIPLYEIDPITNELQTNGLTQPTFAELLMVSNERKRTPGWWPVLINFLGILLLTSVFLGTIGFFYYRYRQQLRKLANPIIEKARDTSEAVRNVIAHAHSFTSHLTSGPTEPSAPEPFVTYRAAAESDEVDFDMPQAMKILKTPYRTSATGTILKPRPAPRTPRPPKIYPDTTEAIDITLSMLNSSIPDDS
jgi:hypothetical protein